MEFYDIFSNPSKFNPSSECQTTKPPATPGFSQRQRPKVENFIMIHASVQQNFSWQDNLGSKFLPGSSNYAYFKDSDLILSAQKDY